jgi:hypothetical protein
MNGMGVAVPKPVVRPLLYMCLALVGPALAACGDEPTGGGSPDAAPPAADAAPPAQGDEARGPVAINEVYPGGAGGPDWIELRSRQASDYDLSGHYLSDAPDRLDHFYRFPDGTVLAPGAYLVVFADDGDTAAGPGHHAPFKMGREDGAYLLDPDGVVIDALLFLGPGDGSGRTLARRPDGEGRFLVLPPTPGAANP